MLRNIAAVLLGMLLGGIVNMGIIMLNSTVLFPMPPGTDMNDPVSFGAYMESLPATAYLVALLAHLAQAGLGGFVAARVGRSAPVVLAMIVGGLTALGSLMNLFAMPAPAWMWADPALCLALAWGAGTLVQRGRA